MTIQLQQQQQMLQVEQHVLLAEAEPQVQLLRYAGNCICCIGSVSPLF